MSEYAYSPIRLLTLPKRSLAHYWRTNLPVVLGVAIAVAVLTGALAVGDSVRASLLEIFLGRLGRTSHVLQSGHFFREELAAELQSHSSLQSGRRGVCPILVLEGLVSHQQSGRRAASVQVYGVDERFWDFHQIIRPRAEIPPRAVWLSPALEAELAAKRGDTLLVRVERPSAIPAESLHGRKEDRGLTLRCEGLGVLPRLADFSLRAGQSEVRAAFIPLARLQKELGLPKRVNTLLVSSPEAASSSIEGQETGLASALRAVCRPFDLGLRTRRPEEAGFFIVEHESTLLGGDAVAAILRAAGKSGLRATPVLTYLANSLRAGSKTIPYSLVTATDFETLPGFAVLRSDKQASDGLPPILLNAWAAHELQVRPGDRLTLEYYVWLEEGRLETRTADFEFRGTLPMTGGGLDADLAPHYPGITDARNLRAWDPPFPLDLSRIRPQDEAYWEQYKTTPKAVVDAQTGRRMWASRYGEQSSIRLSAPDPRELATRYADFESALGGELDPLREGFSVLPVREDGIAASQGATDFGEYFLYFSFFLLGSALILIVLFFKLGIEQRLREIGLLKAVGYPGPQIAKLLVTEGIVLALIGTLLGLAGAAAYSSLVLLGLRTWWIDAVGTTRLEAQLNLRSLATGALGGLVVSILSMLWTLRGSLALYPMDLITGRLSRGSGAGCTKRNRAVAFVRLVSLAAGLGLVILAWIGRIPQTGGFFGAGAALLAALLADQDLRLRRGGARTLRRSGWIGLTQLGLRNAAIRPGRSVLCTALIACATFLIVAVGAFRRGDETVETGRRSGSGGYSLIAESMLPLVQDPESEEGREALNLPAASDEPIRWARFRLRPGDDASCLNLYRPRNPRLLAPTAGFLRENRFRFRESLAQTPQERENPWLLLDRKLGEGIIPAIADANSLAYALHLELGQDWEISPGSGRPVRLRIVASLSDSLFQSELLISEGNFKRLYPTIPGWRFFLIETGRNRESEVGRLLEERLSDFGMDARFASERLASYHRVENAYLSTFQGLGALGLLLGTFGLGAVLVRNALERRKELALQQAVGFGPRHLAWTILTENARLLIGGIFSGCACALLAVLPALLAREAAFPWLFLLLTLLAIVGTGLIASLAAVALVLRMPMLQALRSE